MPLLSKEKKESRDELRQVIAQNICRSMEINNVTVLEVSKKLNLSVGAVYSYRHGRILPPVDALRDICNYLGVPIETMISGVVTIDSIKGFEAKNLRDSILNRIPQEDADTEIKILSILNGIIEILNKKTQKKHWTKR